MEELVQNPEAALGRLEKVLVRERAAIVAFRPEEVRAIAEEKNSLVAEMAEILRSVEGVGSKATLKAAARRVLATAKANHLLLQDAIQLISAHLGLEVKTGMYDGRARMRNGARPYNGRAV